MAEDFMAAITGPREENVRALSSVEVPVGLPDSSTDGLEKYGVFGQLEQPPDAVMHPLYAITDRRQRSQSESSELSQQ
jgi:hypothetical protein